MDATATADVVGEQFPIRVLSQRTGVNTVTLRAWERRYGLLRPRRTPKGHRLYDGADVERILRILAWLQRGVSIGQVRALLDAGADAPVTTPVATATAAAPEAATQADWPRQRERLLRAADTFDETRLDDVFSEVLALYPFALVCEYLLQPLLAALRARHGMPGDAATRAFVEGFLARRLAARVQQGLRHARGPRIGVASLDAGDEIARLVLATGLLAVDARPVLLGGNLGVGDLAVALHRCRPAALLLQAGPDGDTGLLLAALRELHAESTVPLFVTGPRAALLADTPVAGIGTAPGPLAAAAQHIVAGLGAGQSASAVEAAP